ncbi:XAC2610-related protein [Paraflavitalea pollutisoli]|uniref:XAC2610-related protein n=1 Tax=Paraflavitalea pollutisoli TaxID=3034143 RepID=UPI0023EB9408|nr:hypothetical protein [Paraflavitalea sp. H1-2-19X]
MMKHLPYFLLLLFIACGQEPPKTTPAPRWDSLPTAELVKIQDTVTIAETFTDSLRIGSKKHNKVELVNYRQGDTAWVTIKFYSRRDTGWLLKNEFNQDGVYAGVSDPTVLDYNNDRFNDLRYFIGTGARGGNSFYEMFLYDQAGDQLKILKGADDYPNINYNKTLNCLESLALTGSCTTSFLRISGDSVVEFASVDVDGRQITVQELDKDGQMKTTLEKKSSLLCPVKVKNFKPLVIEED